MTSPGGSVNDWFISHIRTGVPMVLGALLMAAEHRWDWFPKIDGQSVAPAAVFAVSYGYYALVRKLEHWRPSLGWLIGYPAQPTYEGKQP